MLASLYSKDVFRFFRYPAGRQTPPEGAFPPGYRVQVFEPGSSVPEQVARVAMPRALLDVMRWRFRRGDASLMAVFDDRGDVASYGWIQSWRPFRRRFRKVAREGSMLGFYWTHPAHRGRGLYRAMLARSLALVRGKEPIIIYASAGNAVSQRGIEGAGFEFLLDLQVTRIAKVLSFARIDAKGGRQ